MSSRFHKLLQHPHTEKALLLLLLTICGLTFGLNMFNFPYYENDEGVYMSQAWSLFETGRLAPYTYWYDHAPFGWIQIGLWAILTGGYFTFGFAINSGRVFMLVIHLINCLFLYLIARKLTASRIWATLTVLLFGLSPLGILLQRRVLLDNLALFWSLISIYFAVYYEKRFYYLILSGFTLGLAILSKESVIFFAPVIAFYILVIAHKQHRLHGIVLWSVTLATLLGLYVTYAFMKNELFPSGSILGGQGDHVSLIETLRFQAQREGGGNILNPSQSQFWQRFFQVWSENDPLLIYGGLFATLANLLLGFRNLHAAFLALLTLSFILFLGRGGLVLDFYIIPLLPMLALNLTYLLHTLIYPLLLFTRNFSIRTLSYALTLLFLILPILHFLYQKDRIGIENFSLYTSNQTKPQIEAVNWIKTKLAPDDYLAFDNYAYLDLKVRDRSQTFPNADWYIKIDTDKEIREKFNNDSKNIEYLALTPQIEQDIATFSQGLPHVEQAFKESREITTFYNDRWRVKIMGQLTPTRMTESAYRSIKAKFTNNQEITWYNTKYIDYKLFLHLAILQNDSQFFQSIFDIFKAKYSNNEQFKNDTLKIITLASTKWPDLDLQNITKQITEDHKSDLRSWRGYTLPFRDTTTNFASISLAKLDPAAYQLLYQQTNDPIWRTVLRDTYRILSLCMTETNSRLPASICDLSYSNGRLAATFYFPVFDTNTLPLLQSIITDAYQFNNPSAQSFLTRYNKLATDWLTSYKVVDTYSNTGIALSDQEQFAVYYTILPHIQRLDSSKAQELYDLKFKNEFKEDAIQTWWGNDPDNLTNILYASLATLTYHKLDISYSI
ncbi:MAG: hypothetical protein KatS3mg087_0900 [Patescibacteria group bacterium]|nr:MAG: hypothetical protein KatS3mg087_0900 [Patescibacteria group bacterium]